MSFVATTAKGVELHASATRTAVSDVTRRTATRSRRARKGAAGLQPTSSQATVRASSAQPQHTGGDADTQGIIPVKCAREYSPDRLVRLVFQTSPPRHVVSRTHPAARWCEHVHGSQVMHGAVRTFTWRCFDHIARVHKLGKHGSKIKLPNSSPHRSCRKRHVGTLREHIRNLLRPTAGGGHF